MEWRSFSPARGRRRQAKRLYSNLDIEHMNQMTGMVKYEGKTEHLE